MVDMYENCTCKCLNYYSVFNSVTVIKPCFKSIQYRRLCSNAIKNN